MKTIIEPNQWNKLSSSTKMSRVLKFNKHMQYACNKYPLTPIDRSQLTSWAIHFQTPVPIYTDGKIDWGDYQ